MTTDLKAESYISLLQTLKQEITQARAHLSVNKEMIVLYWNIGNKILKRQTEEGWGTKVIENISNDLRKEFPEMKGLSYQNISYIRQFAFEYKNDQFLQQAIGEIPWGHNVTLFSQIKNLGADNYQQAITNLIEMIKLYKIALWEPKSYEIYDLYGSDPMIAGNNNTRF